MWILYCYRSKENVDLEEVHSSLNSKKKHKKDKRKHKKHSTDKSEKDKSKKHKKHKKSKHKDNTEKLDKNGDYTPEPEKKESVIPNGKESVDVLDPIQTANFIVEAVEVETKKSLTDIVSSESDVQDADCDSIDIDLDLIEADMDLEELMKQKELLQAQLAKAESEGIISPQDITEEKEKPTEEIILLDDSDEPETSVPEVNKRKRSKSRDRKILMRSREDIKRRRTHSRERMHREQEREIQLSK